MARGRPSGFTHSPETKRKIAESARRATRAYWSSPDGLARRAEQGRLLRAGKARKRAQRKGKAA
jgi:hypothetical protein